MKKVGLLVRDYVIGIILFAAAYEIIYYAWHGKFPPFWD